MGNRVSEHLSYALITPARDEAENLARLAESVGRQTRPPLEWLVVDNGSTDGTATSVLEIGEKLPFARLVQIEGSDAGRGPASVRAFTAGLAKLSVQADIVVNLDADVSMPPEYFEELLHEFEADATLGIASGACLEEQGGRWQEVPVTGEHLRGATRAYRRACLENVLPLEERVGWDGIDIYKARAHGWTTRTIRRIAFKHHRLLGERDGSRTRAWREQGRAAHYMGYRSYYIVLRSVRRSFDEPAALAMLGGYFGCVLHRAPQIDDRDVIDAVRRDQSLGHVPERVRSSFAHARSRN